MKMALGLWLLLVTLPLGARAQTGGYTSTGTCDGLPRIDVSTPQGVCVGVVADGFRFPRTVTPLADGSLIVVDMGGWVPRRGSVWRLAPHASSKTYVKRQLLDRLDRPHGAAIGPDGLLYIGELSRVFRFNPDAADPAATVETVVAGLPTTGRHPLTALLFDTQGYLYVNRGSASDNCEPTAGYRRANGRLCPEAQGSSARGVIRRYALTGPNRTATRWSNYAVGLRNSMALAVHPKSGLLLQGENSRDSIRRVDPRLNDRTEPREELNILSPWQDYGWPYCYNDNKPSPEFKDFDCSRMRKPALLMPAHVAPLGMTYYFGGMFPPWYKGKLLVTWHGYRDFGQKLVAIATDAAGRPVGEPLEVIKGWHKKGSQPMGAPVGVAVSRDGSIFLAEDKNGTVLRLYFDPRQGDGIPTPGLSVNPIGDPGQEARCQALATRDDAFSRIQRDIIDPLCTNCHGAAGGNAGNLRLARCDDIGNAQRLLAPRPGAAPFVIPRNLKSELYLRLQGTTPGLPPMPAGGLNPEQLNDVAGWINQGAPVPASQASSDGRPMATQGPP
ncbi:glucose/arabinose dehydrogenase [Archangium gephyra]|uniref:Glucose/arabinose dehydrogenase n=1 Tax=Archangium gephyra TaxID=48 RepID=A0AAC8Q1G4_9BACT|nr:PQQ-dependent sugar dehydrogenase [Archangium gephyra]AKI99173.1 L-sorbosone dehydrogenase [Archangium gephyra]REG31078.1 glucose/arabinose dehydrogenase [Archangium gephyra]